MEIVYNKKHNTSVNLADIKDGEVFMFCNSNDQFYIKACGNYTGSEIATVNLATGAWAFINKSQSVKKVKCKLVIENND